MPLTAIENNQFRIYSAQKFIEGLQSQTSQNNLYVWIGKVTPWSNENNPPQPNDTVAARISSFADMLSAKRVSPSDASLVIPRHNWQPSTVYSQYSDLGAIASGIYYDLYEPNTNTAPFYVITTDYNVYKCISNNYGANTSVMPTGTSTTPITTADGYIWKFMFQVSSANVLKFLSDDWIPVYSLSSNDGTTQWSVQATAVPGSIEFIQVTNVGSSYTSVPPVTVLGDGVGCTAVAVLTGTTVTGINIITKGQGYSYATVTIGGPGSNAAAHAMISPPGGHGSNAVAELGAMYVMVDVSLNYDESNKITTGNDYRKFGLLLNPLFYESQVYYYPLIATATTNLTLTGVTGTFDPDVLVTGSTSGVTGRVVDFDLAGSNILRLNEVTRGTASGYLSTASGFVVSETLITASGIAEISSVVAPDIEPNSGLILTTEYMSPVMRSPSQIEDIKITLPF